ncbi:MAG: tetratricopeptide repeat protein [Bacteroidales bacterium]|jgi:tetratricopeptide (TPR) repeat protein|nr:tetratricopeptide repeat protein [Bacteroidales bacterium]MCI1784717.1 tetratricopeptide repeat protein [Bacteroidales bacterium]
MTIKKSYILFTVVALVLFPRLSAAQGRPSLGVSWSIVDAVTMYGNGQYVQAKSLLNKVVTVKPSEDAAYYYMGLCDLHLSDYKAAVSEFKKAVSIDPGNYWYRDKLAVLYSMTGNEDLAEDMFVKLLADFPGKSDLYYNLVNIYIKQKQYDKALSTLDSIETVFGKSEEVTSTRYGILNSRNKPEEAFKALLDYNKDNSSPTILSLLGDHEMSEYKDSSAMAYYNEALSLYKGYAPALFGKAEVFRIRRDYDNYFSVMHSVVQEDNIPSQVKCRYISALFRQGDPRFLQTFLPRVDSLVNECIGIYPGDTTVLQTAGLYFYSTGRNDKAKTYLRKNVELDPGSVSATATYIQFLAYTKDWKAVISESDKALERFPEETGFLEMKNMAYYNLKEYKNVILSCEKIISIAQDDTSRTLPAYSSMGDMYHEMGDSKKAYQAYEKALKINPDYLPVLNNYAYYLSVENKKLKKAYSMSKRTIEKEPDNATYLDTFGWILHLQGLDLEAKAFFKHAMLYGGKESVTVLDHYAEVLYALKEYDLASVYWDYAKQKNKGEIPGLEKKIKEKLDAIKGK